MCVNIIIKDVNNLKNFNRQQYSNMNRDICVNIIIQGVNNQRTSIAVLFQYEQGYMCE